MSESTPASREMPRYVCHKRVWALQIASVEPHGDGSATIYPADARYGPLPADAEYIRKHAPTAGGYYVVYEDGYKSFSPATPFESGYTLEK